MLQDIKQFYGIKLGAIDGEIGHVKDFYFDDKSWALRYVVADTGSWLSGREVLLSPHAFSPEALGRFDPATKVLPVYLTKLQIENSPPIESHQPVSRQYEELYYTYYGWPTYWGDGAIMLGAGVPMVPAEPVAVSPGNHLHNGHNQRNDRHLQSTKSLTGFRIHATDGEIGSVTGFMVHGHRWAIGELIVETGHWYAGKTILLLTKNVSRISYEDSCVFVNLTKDDIRKTLPDDVAHVGGSRH